MKDNASPSLSELSKQIRRVILEQAKRAHVGHIGSALSIVEIIETLYWHVLNIPSTTSPDRDRLILSKGHAALALFAALYLKGLISKADIDSYCTDGTLLGVHPEYGLPGIDFSSGSLGQGLSMGVGAALAARLQKSPRRVYVVLSDAECNEGSVWEAVAFAAHHRLGNLTAIVDLNGQQAFGYTEQVLSLNPLAKRWEVCGWDVHSIDGHDVSAMATAITGLNAQRSAPQVVIAKTCFGKGVSFMESQIKWHYLPMSDGEYQQALREIGVVS